MLTYILRRLLLMVPTLVGMTLLLFVVIRFSPGVASGSAFAAGAEMQSTEAREEQILKIKRRLGMVDAQGQPIPMVMQYFYWLGRTVQPEMATFHIGTTSFKAPWIKVDLGDSMQYRKPVVNLIQERLPVTITLNLIVTFVVYLLAIPGGMLSAARRGKGFDVGWSFSTLAMYSLPTMWIGSLLIGFLANPRYLGWFPSAGLHSTDTTNMAFFDYLRDYLWHLVLPVVVLSYGGFAYLSKQMRASMLDNLSMDYARTARAKGLSGFVVVTRHVFRNSLLPLITIATGIIPGLLGGSVIVETIFSIKGMGELAYRATLARDLPVIQALGLVSGILVLFSYLITDICYALADPRVSYD